MKKSLVLTGMMGVGKSTIGRLLAKKLRFKFIDVDRLIERQEKRSIKKIFDVDGEEYFRKMVLEPPGSQASWNTRDQHMLMTIMRIRNRFQQILKNIYL